MNRIILFCLLGTTAGTAFAAKPCEDLKSEIAAKLDAKHVVGYELQIASKADEGTGTVVGTCEGGTKKILYTRGTAKTDAAAAASDKTAGDETKK